MKLCCILFGEAFGFAEKNEQPNKYLEVIT